MADNTINRLFKLATAPTRFAIRQTRTNIRALRELSEDFQAYQPVLERAAEETLANVASVLVAAEASLPDDMEDMTPREREDAIANSLARGEHHLLAALGEVYRSYRLMTTQRKNLIIENPPQAELVHKTR
jgi:hypothetical protein